MPIPPTRPHTHCRKVTSMVSTSNDGIMTEYMIKYFALRENGKHRPTDLLETLYMADCHRAGKDLRAARQEYDTAIWNGISRRPSASGSTTSRASWRRWRAIASRCGASATSGGRSRGLAQPDPVRPYPCPASRCSLDSAPHHKERAWRLGPQRRISPMS